MRKEPNLRIENFRDNSHPAFMSEPGKNWGGFRIPGKLGILTVLSSGGPHEDDMGWEHVSVSYPNLMPTWEDMDKVKRLFWADDETVVQFHPRKDQKINQHEFCLHLWKPSNFEIALPPRILVG